MQHSDSPEHQQSKPKQKVNIWFSKLFENFGKHLLSLVFVVVIFIAFRLPQINDLILIIIQDDDHLWIMLRFYTLIVLLAFLMANAHLLLKSNNRTQPIDRENGLLKYIKSLLFNLNPEDEKEQLLVSGPNMQKHKSPHQMDVLFPKLLATIFILSIAFAVDTAYYEFYGDQILLKGHWAFLIIILLMILATSDTVVTAMKKVIPKKLRMIFPLIVVITCIAAIILLGALNQQGTQRDFKYLFYSLLALALLFYALSVSYNKRLLKIKGKYGVAFGIVLITLTLVYYVRLIFDPTISLGSPLNIILICLNTIFIVMIGLKIWGSYINVPLLPLGIILGILATVFIAKAETFDRYEVDMVKPDFLASERMTLDDYADKWVANRKMDIDSLNPDRKFPIVLVSSEGGGSRAGHWSLLVQSYLYKNNPNYFQKHLFSLTGASGGSVGNNLFYTVAYENRTRKDTSVFSSTKGTFTYKASDFYSHDYISASIAGLLGNDLVASIISCAPSKDRGKILDEQWETFFKIYFGFDGLKQPYLKQYYDSSFVPPLLVTNTTKVKTGNLNVMSNITFNEDLPTKNGQPTSFQFEDLLDSIARFHADSTLKQSTAMRFNASFPYISPNGRIPKIGQFGDSGYYDNVGGVVTRRLEQALLQALKRAEIGMDKVSIEHLVIVNNTKLEEMDCCIEPDEGSTDYFSQLITPAKIVIQATFAHPNDFMDAAPRRLKIESERTPIPPKEPNSFSKIVLGEGKPYCPIIPLGRYMSKDALKSLEARLKQDEVSSKLNRLLARMKRVNDTTKNPVSL